MNRLQIRHFSKLGGNLMRREAVDGPQPLKNDAEKLSIESKLLLKRQRIRNQLTEIEKNSSARFPAFEDTFGRKHTYLRISLTEKCNLRCLYCMPEEGVSLTPKPHILTANEIVRLVEVFASHGVEKVRLTGGEPSVRKDLVDIIRRVNAVEGIQQVGITTNGVALHRTLPELKKAGLQMLNISLDTLDPEKYLMITRRNGFKMVMKTIEMAESMFDYVKINAVMMKGVNDKELIDFIEMTRNRNLSIRFIEFMPFGGNRFSLDKFVGYSSLLERARQHYNSSFTRLINTPNDTNKAFKVEGYKGEFGFITSMTDHFCGTCNRVRITADGNLKALIGAENEELRLWWALDPFSRLPMTVKSIGFRYGEFGSLSVEFVKSNE